MYSQNYLFEGYLNIKLAHCSEGLYSALLGLPQIMSDVSLLLTPAAGASYIIVGAYRWSGEINKMKTNTAAPSPPKQKVSFEAISTSLLHCAMSNWL